MGRHSTLTSEQRREVWRRWKSGEAAAQIAAALAISRFPIEHALVKAGGIAPRERERSERHLSVRERESISRALAAGQSLRQIASDLGRACSTVSREVQRNGGRTRYRACAAEDRAWQAARRPKQCRLAINGRLQALVAEKLADKWAPQQISNWLEREHPEDDNLRVSTETIYQSLYVQTRGALKKELIAELRLASRIRHPHGYSPGKRGQIVGAIPISQRPAEANDRAVPGHWEGDLIYGSNNSYIGTLVERHSRYVILMKLKGKDTKTVIAALTKHIQALPIELRRSVTWDRGLEMADHAQFTVDTKVQVYFCDPQSPWQRGSNENTNGLLRQYFPKGTDLSIHSQVRLNRVAAELNERPRMTLGWACPKEALEAALR